MYDENLHKDKVLDYYANMMIDQAPDAMALREKVKTTTGKDIDVGCDIICVHSDTPNAVEIITKLKNAIKN